MIVVVVYVFQPSSSACRGNSPPASSVSYSPASQLGGSPVAMATAARKQPSGPGNHRASTVHAKSAAESTTQHAKCRSHMAGSPTNPAHHHRGVRRFTPSPPHSRGGSGMGAGTTGGGGTSTVRNAPYYSPRDSPRSGGGGALRGSARNSPPKESSPRSHTSGSLRGVSRSPPYCSPRTSPVGDAGFSVTPPPQDVNCDCSGSSAETTPDGSPAAARKPLLVNLNENRPNTPTTYNSNIVPLERTLSPYQTPPISGHTPSVLASHSEHSSLEVPHQSNAISPPVSPGPLLSESQSPPTSGSQSPLHTLNFEDGRVLSQLPYEYSSFLDLPTSALGWYSYTWWW